jgi:hypothetical protein
MNGDGAMGRQDDVGGGEVGVRESNIGAVNRMSRREGEMITLSHLIIDLKI